MSQTEAGVRGPEERERNLGSPGGKAPGLPPPELLLSPVLCVVVLDTVPLTKGSSAFKNDLQTTG